MKELNVRQAAEFLGSADDFLIYTHTNPDADTVGSAAALVTLLRRIGKKAVACCADELPRRLSFITECGEGLFVPAPEVLPEGKTYISVDVAAAGQLGDTPVPLFDLSIDHHDVNRIECKRLLLKNDYIAAGEIIFELMDEFGMEPDKKIACMLYDAISSDSGSFKYYGTSPKTHRTAARLLETGIDFAKISRLLFENKTRIQTELEKAAYNRLEFCCGGRAAVVALDEELMASVGAKESDVDCVNQIPRQIEGVEVSAVLRPSGGGTKISMRSNDYFNVADFCASLGGGGHLHAAGFRLDMPVAAARDRLVGLLEGRL